jgi:excisionase family DNA binding protein
MSVDTLDRLVARGEIRSILRGRLRLFYARELDRWASENQARTLEP